MKDDDKKVELTYGDVRRAAETCPTARAALTALAPNVFDAAWIDVTGSLELCPETTVGNVPVLALKGLNQATGLNWPFMVVVNPESVGAVNAKVENGRAYYRKA